VTFVTADMSILSRMTKRPSGGAKDVPVTSSRALRLAVARAADRSLNLTLTVGQVTEDLQSLDEMVANLPAQTSFLRLERAGVLVGLFGLDMQLRAAAIEMQTMGRVAQHVAVDRSQTGTDLMFATPLCEAVLSLLPHSTAGSDLEGWADGAMLAAPFDDARAVGLALSDADYRVMCVTVDLISDKRQGHVIIALPNHQPAAVITPEISADSTWDKRMRATVAEAPAALQAVLHKMQLPLGKVDGLQVGDILPLYGATVASVRLFAPDQVLVGTARLGQSGGMRAVRVQAPPEADLHDMPAPKRVKITAPV